MNITKSIVCEKLNISLEGRLDTNTSVMLEHEILEEYIKHKNIVIDFAKLTFISSAGLRALLIGHKTAMSKGGTLELINVPECIMNVFKMTGFSDILTIK